MGSLALLLATNLPLVWLLIAIILGVIEAVTVDLVAIWFAISALVAIIPAALHAPFFVQLFVFLLVGLLALALTRPVIKNLLHVKKTSTNADRVIGMMGVVTVAIDNIEGNGRIRVNGLDWAARSDDGSPIAVGERVLVRSIEGVTLVVELIV